MEDAIYILLGFAAFTLFYGLIVLCEKA